MRYFDKILSEALNVLHDRDLQNAMSKIWKKAKAIQKSGLSEDAKRTKLEQLGHEMQALHRDENAEQFKEFTEKFRQANAGDRDFEAAIEQMSRSGDPLLLWMLKHMASQAEAT